MWATAWFSSESSTRPESAQTPMVAGSGRRRGTRSAALGAARVELFKGDDVAIRVLHDEPARAPLGLLGLPEHVRAGGHLLEARVDVVDVEMQAGRGGGL